MNPGLFAVVALAGGAGAGLRWLVDAALAPRLPHRFPWAILIVNVSGSLLLGALVGASAVLEASFVAAVGTGLLGGFTTFSTVMVESVVLWRRAERTRAWGNVLGTAVAAIAAAGSGLLAGGWVTGLVGVSG